MLRHLTYLLPAAAGLLTLCLAQLTPVAAAEAGAPAEGTTGPSLRVMTFNIRFNNPLDGINAWPLRKERAFNLFRKYQPDLVGVQEALRGQLDDLATALPDYAWLGVGRDDGKDAGEFSAILYRKSRFEVLEQATFWLSPEPNVPGKKGWDADCTRVVTWCRLRDKATGKVLCHFNTHFDHRGERARQESARLILARIAEIAGSAPVLFTGDLNTTAEARPYKILTGALEPADAAKPEVVKDARVVSKGGHQGPNFTFTGFRVGPTSGNTIDYIFVKNRVSVLHHATLGDSWQSFYASDHLPVLAEVVLD